MASKNKTVSHVRSSSGVGAGGGTPRKLPKPTIQFKIGSDEGFSNSDLTKFSGNSASAIRELVQNSLDASVENENEVAKVDFIVERTDIKKIPGIKQYKVALEAAVREHSGHGQQGDNIAASLQGAIENEESFTLFVIDNGIGFDEDNLSAIYSNGISLKGSSMSAGSFGNGHLTTFSLSDLQYVLYGGISAGKKKIANKGKIIFGGHAIIASHWGEIASKPGQKRSLGKDGYYVSGLNAEGLFGEDAFVFPDKDDMPNFIGDKIKIIREWESGSVIAIPAFNHFGRDPYEVMDLIIDSVAINFFVAIHQGRLCITVSIDGKKKTISQEKLKECLESCKEKKRRSVIGFPSGYTAWNSYQTLLRGESKTITTSQGKIDMRIRIGEGNKDVALCRNGMWITKSIPKIKGKFADKKSFDALLLIDKDDDKEDDKEIYDAFREAEGPEHIDIKTDDSSRGTPEKRAKFKESLREIVQEIRDLLPDMPNDEWQPDNFLVLEGEEATKSSIPRVEKATLSPGGERGRGGGAGREGSGRPPPSRSLKSGKVLPVRISSTRPEQGVAKVCFNPSDGCDNVEFRMNVDRGKDDTCTGDLDREDWEIISLKSVKIDGEEVPKDRFIKDGDKAVGVYLGSVTAGQMRNMIIEYNAPPPSLGDYAINWFFLRRKKLSPTETGEQL